MPKICRKGSPKTNKKGINVSITKGKISIDKKYTKVNQSMPKPQNISL